jgi:hypothetical protein
MYKLWRTAKEGSPERESLAAQQRALYGEAFNRAGGAAAVAGIAWIGS